MPEKNQTATNDRHSANAGIMHSPQSHRSGTTLAICKLVPSLPQGPRGLYQASKPSGRRRRRYHLLSRTGTTLAICKLVPVLPLGHRTVIVVCSVNIAPSGLKWTSPDLRSGDELPDYVGGPYALGVGWGPPLTLKNLVRLLLALRAAPFRPFGLTA